MKVSVSLALIVLVGLVASSNALPAKRSMLYYQQQPAQWYNGPQRMMYVQYVQPSHTHARSTQAASALVSGETVATGTYLKEADIAAAGPSVDFVASAADEEQVAFAGEDVLGAAGAHGTHAVAEAYPEEVPQQAVDVEIELDAAPGAVAAVPEVEITASSNDAAKVPRDYNFETEVEAEVPAVAVEIPLAAELPAPAPIAPVATPARRYLPAKRKIYVELEHASAEDESEDEAETAVAVAQEAEADAEEEEDTYTAPIVPIAPKYPARVPNARRPVAKKPAKAAAAAPKPSKPLPAGTFFPINFGGTSGGAIAIANAFSTGEGGAATSHAIAYGTPEAARAGIRPSVRRH